MRASTLLSEMPSRILIADDSALLRSALRGLFNGIGDYEILEAESGTEAVAKTNECRPNLIILDFALLFISLASEGIYG